jgi:hypothetical protein
MQVDEAGGDQLVRIVGDIDRRIARSDSGKLAEVDDPSGLEHQQTIGNIADTVGGRRRQ